MAYPSHGACYSEEKEQITNTCKNMDESPKNNFERNSGTKKYILLDSIYIKFKSKQN